MIRPAHHGIEVWLCVEPVDFRKQITGLATLVQDQLSKDPFSAQLFAFTNRRRTQCRILYWERCGFVLWHKRLERARFAYLIARKLVSRLRDGRTLEPPATPSECERPCHPLVATPRTAESDAISMRARGIASRSVGTTPTDSRAPGSRCRAMSPPLFTYRCIGAPARPASPPRTASHHHGWCLSPRTKRWIVSGRHAQAISMSAQPNSISRQICDQMAEDA